MTNPNNHLVIFAKEPRIGRVKSRLARGIGRLAAWQFYRVNLNSKIKSLTSGRQFTFSWTTWIAITPDTTRRSGTQSIKQGSGDLGHRMGRVFQDMPPGPVVIIGTDIPGITPDHIAQAFKALGNHDCVLGPATDGGYWLIGMKRRPQSQMNAARHIFSNVRWSSQHALADTQRNLEQRGLSIAMLEPLEDVDDKPSYERWITGAR